MSANPENVVLNLSFISMQIVGEATSQTSVKLRVFRAVNISVMCFLIYFIFLNFFHVKGEVYIEALESFTSISHVFLKYILLLYNKNDIQKAFGDIRNRFWNFRHFSERVQKSSERTFRIANNMQVTLIITMYLVLYMYLLRSIYDNKYSFLLKTFVPDSIAVDALILFCQFYLFLVSSVFVYGYDIAYLLLCMHLILQTKLLKLKIQEVVKMSDRKVMREMKNWIVYHEFLLNMFSRMKSIFSAVLLFHYFVTVVTACSDLFILVRYTDITVIGIRFTTLIYLFAQFAYYTFLADEVACQFSDVASAVYMSKWYNGNSNVQKSLLFVMVKCQRMQYFSGAGLMDINAETYGSVVRKTFSFYAIMRNVLTK